MELTAAYPKAVRDRQWYRLDNAGKLYPALSTAKWDSVFRISAAMKQDIEPKRLQRAVDSVMPRFVTMNTQLCKGVFWYYLEENPKRLLIQEDQIVPCAALSWREKNGHLMRVLYAGRRLSVEYFHAITDGAGAMVFLKTLIAEYLRLRGTSIPCEDGILDLRSKPVATELEDAFQRMPLPKNIKRTIEGSAYRFPGEKMTSPHARSITTYCMSASQVKEKAKSIGATLTEYLTAAILLVGYQEQEKENPRKKLPVRVSVPINMRQVFPTDSLRNCSWFVNPEIAPPFGDLTLESITAQVRSFMKEALLPENLYAGIAPNVASENSLLLRLAPLPIKNLVIRSVHKAMGIKMVTTTLSNLGLFKAPAAMMEEIEWVDVVLGPTKGAGTGAALITTGDRLRLTYTSNQETPVLPGAFERLLRQEGLSITKEVLWG
ncbi:MAG: hypothetical protein WDA02_04195 [Saccharofermentanales bacterium]